MTQRSFTTLITLFILGALISQSFANEKSASQKPEYLSDTTQRITWVRQGWGELGLDAMVRAPEAKSPMPLHIGNKTYSKGLGTHANSEIFVNLEGLYASFEAEAGLQDSRNGSVVFQVYGDGKKLYDSGLVKGGEPPRSVHVSVDGVEQLKLVVTDGGDGMDADMANWAEARLIGTRASQEAGRAVERVDLAAFARVVTSDPSRMEGTKADRLDEFPEKDLILETDLVPGKDGNYTVPAPPQWKGGCIGLTWIERRRVRSLGLEFAPGSSVPPSEGVEVQGWVNPFSREWGADSAWQGKWAPLQGKFVRQGNRWTFTLFQKSFESSSQQGLRKIRWIFPPTERLIQVKRLFARTDSRWETIKLKLSAKKPMFGERGKVEVYNGEFVDLPGRKGNGTSTEWNMDKSLKIKVRASKPEPWQSDRTILRIKLPSGSFAVAVDDVLTSEGVYLPDFDFLAAREGTGLSLEKAAEKARRSKTILDCVEEKPDQTFAGALNAVHMVGHDLSPVYLGLPGENHKIEVRREGEIQYDTIPDDPAYPDPKRLYPGIYIDLCYGLAPKFGSGKNEKLSRRLEEGWMPIPTTTVEEGAIRYRQRALLAPFDGNATSTSLFGCKRALGVVEFTIENTGKQAAQASLKVDFFADRTRGKRVAAQVESAVDGAVIRDKGKLLASVELKKAGELEKSLQGGAFTLAGKLAPGASVQCFVYLPTWEMKPDERGTLQGGTELLARTKDIWNRLMAPAMKVELPDPMLQNVILASQTNCLLATRGEEGGARLAPWIAEFGYGPLDSEAHAIIRGMDYMGHQDFARRSLEFYIKRYNPAGYLAHGYTLIATGQHLWTLGDYAALSGDRGWMTRMAPGVKKLCDWTVRQSEKTRRRDGRGGQIPEFGLLPPGVTADPPAFNYSFFANGYYYAGLKSSAEALGRIGDPRAAEIGKQAENYKRCIIGAYHWMQAHAPALPLANGTWVPACSGDLYGYEPGLFYGQGRGLVELGAQTLAPQGVFTPESREMRWIMNYLEDKRFIADDFGEGRYDLKDWFGVGGFSKAQPYYTRTGEIYAMQDAVKPFIRSYFNTIASCLNTEALYTWECPSLRNGQWAKTHEIGYFLFQTRLMLLMERGNELWLAPFLTNQWMKEGMTVAVKNAPTFFGPAGYRITSHVKQGFIEAEIEPPTRQVPGELVLRLRHPEGKPMRRVTVNGADHPAFDAKKEIIRIKPAKAGGAGTIRVKAEY